jgi:hypothetical protein
MTTDSLPETKENLSIIRDKESKSNFMKGNNAYTEFEKTYGKYLFLPYDVPTIKLNDIEKFTSWFYDNSLNATKVGKDFSYGTLPASDNTYLSIDSSVWRTVWSKNPRPEIFTLFPELFEQIHEYMPWVGKQDFLWSLWSSRENIPEHRDITSCVDVPHSMRIKLFDTNPEETLSLRCDPPMMDHSNEYVTIPMPDDTNSFGWNNLRTKHKSVYHGGDFKKILFIWRGQLSTDEQVTQLADLFDRSIAKYSSQPGMVWVDTNTETDYLSL